MRCGREGGRKRGRDGETERHHPLTRSEMLKRRRRGRRGREEERG